MKSTRIAMPSVSFAIYVGSWQNPEFTQLQLYVPKFR